MTRGRIGRLAVIAAVVLAAHTSDALAQGLQDTVKCTGGLTASQEAVFPTAANTWESIITGYRPPGVTLTGITISASGAAIDGPGGVLGSAGPNATVLTGGFRYATSGSMQF